MRDKNCLLECLEKNAHIKRQFDKIVTDGSKIFTQSLRREVGTASKRHDWIGEFMMIFMISSISFSETSLL